MSGDMVKCSICGRREAFYYQQASGHRLCGRCLERFLYKRIKKTMSQSNVFKPKPRILYIIPCGFILESIALLDILYKIEKRYSGSITLYTPDHVLDYIASRGYGLEAITYSCCREVDDVVRHIVELIGDTASRVREYDLALLPLTRNHLLAIQIILTAIDPGKLWITKLVFRYNGALYTYPAYHIGLHDIVAYAYKRGLLREPVRDSIVSDKLFTNTLEFTLLLWRKTCELLYSSIRGFEYITG